MVIIHFPLAAYQMTVKKEICPIKTKNDLLTSVHLYVIVKKIQLYPENQNEISRIRFFKISSSEKTRINLPPTLNHSPSLLIVTFVDFHHFLNCNQVHQMLLYFFHGKETK